MNTVVVLLFQQALGSADSGSVQERLVQARTQLNGALELVDLVEDLLGYDEEDGGGDMAAKGKTPPPAAPEKPAAKNAQPSPRR